MASWIETLRMRRVAAVALCCAGFAAAAFGQTDSVEAPSEAATLAEEAQTKAAGIAAAVGRGEDPASVAALADEALAAAERALALEPEGHASYLAIGLVHRSLWRFSAARRAYERAYALAPRDPAVLFNFGWFNSFSGRHAQAIAMAERGIELARNDANAHRDLGIAHAYAGNAAEAQTALAQCIALNPRVAVCHIWRSFMLGLLGQADEAAQALALAEQLAGDTMNAATTSSIAHSYSRIGRHADAARLFARLERLALDGVVGAGSWPLGHLAVGDTAEAYVALERAVAKVENHEPDEGFFNLMIIKSNVLRNPVLDEPRFVALRERIGAF